MRKKLTTNPSFEFEPLIDAAGRAASGVAEPNDVLEFGRRYRDFERWYREVYWPAARQKWPKSRRWQGPAEPGPAALDGHVVQEAQDLGHNGALFRKYLKAAHLHVATAAGTDMRPTKPSGGSSSSIGARSPRQGNGSGAL